MSDILESFHIPTAGKTKQRISMKDIFEQLDLSSQEKKILNSEIASIHLVGVLDSDTLRVQSFVDDEYVYEAIYVLQVFLKNDLHLNAINERLHMAFPNPIIILYLFENNNLISVALKRVNKSIKEKSVIEAFYSTNLFGIDEDHYSFIKLLDFQHIQALNLKEFYERVTDIIYSERLIELIGKYPDKIPNSFDLKVGIKRVENEVTILNGLKDKYNQASMMAEKMDYHMKIKLKETEIADYISQIKEELIYE